MKLNGLEKYFKTDKNGEIINFKQVNKKKQTSLIYAFRDNHSSDLNLSADQWDYLIQNNDLKQVNKNGRSPLMYALIYKKNLKKEQWKYLIHNSNLSLIKNKEQLIELKTIQSELLNYEMLNKIDIKENNKKTNKI